MSELGIVIIGRNEGERLPLCLRSLVGRGHPVVYVDSGSTDRSVELARALNVEVVELDMTVSFTAARARNAGVARLREIMPDARFVQFVDGDCEVIDGWLERAAIELRARTDAAVVCGRLRERYPERSIYNRMADMEWDTPVGEVEACGGIAMMRLDAFRTAGGFNPALIAGEEPELCLRLRRQGAKVLRLTAEMAWHDMAMTHFSQWWRRAVRGGYGGLAVVTQVGGDAAPFAKQVRRARIWTVGLVAFGALFSTIVGLLGGLLIGAAAAGAVALMPVLQAVRLAVRARARGRDGRTALVYGVLIMIGKWAELTGHLKYLLDRIGGRKSTLIEYKRPGLETAMVVPGR